jgi:type I restriction enzyme M protein
MNFTATASFIWSVADLLRGDYKQSDYGKVILPFTLLRRLDCVLQETKPAVLAEYELRKGSSLPLDPILTRKAKQSFYNISPLNFQKLLDDSGNIKANLLRYVNAFSPSARDVFERYQFPEQIERLDNSNLLYQTVQKFAAVDLHPNTVDNAHMGLIFDELIRRFAELSNETAGEHYTPREVIRLMVNLLFIADDDALTQAGIVRSIYDPAAGTGGMLSIAEEHLRDMNPEARLVVFGQELNPESFAICKADMLVKGQEVSSIVFGNTLSEDAGAGRARLRQHGADGRQGAALRRPGPRHPATQLEGGDVQLAPFVQPELAGSPPSRAGVRPETAEKGGFGRKRSPKAGAKPQKNRFRAKGVLF